MKRVFTAPTITEAYLIKGILENEGIAAFVKNEHLSGLAGEIPFMESWPEVWIIDDEKSDLAVAMITRYHQRLKAV